jgi:hypothetical protein
MMKKTASNRFERSVHFRTRFPQAALWRSRIFVNLLRIKPEFGKQLVNHSCPRTYALRMASMERRHQSASRDAACTRVADQGQEIHGCVFQVESAFSNEDSRLLTLHRHCARRRLHHRSITEFSNQRRSFGSIIGRNFDSVHGKFECHGPMIARKDFKKATAHRMRHDSYSE